jgi:mRNA-degrading endonuclease RelE of RelBE toxin-antitoxin system
MVYSFEIKPELIEKIKKIKKKDKTLFQRIQKKNSRNYREPKPLQAFEI